MTIEHSDIPIGANHSPFNWIVTSVANLPTNVAYADVGKTCWVQGVATYILANSDPIQWELQSPTVVSGEVNLDNQLVLTLSNSEEVLIDLPEGLAISSLGYDEPSGTLTISTNQGDYTVNIPYKSYTDTVAANLAPKDSPTFTGTVTVPTATLHDNSTKAASTAFVRNELGELKTDIVTLADATDVTKKVVFSLAAVGAGQTRSLIFPNINVNLGRITSAMSYSAGVLTLTDLVAGTLTANIGAMTTVSLADANTTLVKNTSYILPTLTAPRNYTLPATPAEGDAIQIRSGKFAQFLPSLLRNGSTINGTAADFQLSLEGTYTVAYIGGTWRVSYAIGDSFDNSRNTYTSLRNLNILGYGNSFAGTYSAVLASRLSTVGSSTDASAVVAGTGHSLNSPTSAILSGNGNTVLRAGGATAAVNSWVGGGSSNTVSLASGKTGAWVGGGSDNATYGTYSWIGGGSGNTVNNDFGVVLTGTTSTVSGNGSVVLTSGASSGATQSSAYAVSFNGTNDLAFGDGHTVLGAGTATYKAGEFVANLTNSVANGLTAATPSTVNSTQFPVVQASLNASNLQVAYVNAIIFVTSGFNDEYVLAARKVRLHRNNGGTLTILGTDVISTDVGANFSAVTITPTISGNNLYFATQITCATTRNVRIVTNIRALLAPN